MSSKKGKEVNILKTKKTENAEDSFLDQTLRPTSWDEYIGQKHIKDNVKILLRAADERGHISEPAMESGVLDIIIGKGPSARTIQLDLPPFTLIAATTRVALVSSPLRSRFSGGVFRLEFYSDEEIARIVQRSSKLLKIELTEEALKEIAKRSRFTPRTANYFLKRCRDFAQVHKNNLDQKTVRDALNMLAIDDLGLNSSDRKFLEILIEKFNGGPVGLKTIGAAMSEEEATVEEVIEPYLIQLGLLERTARGRVATKKAYEHLGFDIKKGQEKLI